MDVVTKDWKLYEAGKQYNASRNIVEQAKINTEFYEGNQWIGAEDTSLPKPVFNILKRVGSFFTANLTASPIKIFLTPLLYENFDKEIAKQAKDYDNSGLKELVDAIDVANASMIKIMERQNFQDKIRDAVTRSIKTGDMAFHFKFNTAIKPYVYAPKHLYQGDVEIEVIDGVNVFFSNANINDKEKQDYIIISGRDTVEHLKQERVSKSIGNEIVSDNDTEDFIRHNEEINADEDTTNQATYIIKYFKKKDKNGNVKVYANKSTKNAVIYENLDTGLTLYPVAFGNWEMQSGCYHGRAMCTGLIANQIFINRMWAMWQYSLQLNAFPKAIYNASRIANWSSKLGQAIPVSDNGEPNFDIRNMATYIEPPQISAQIVQALDACMAQTKDSLGISDAQLGNVAAYNTSAIVALQKSSAVPLKNQQGNLYNFVEQCANIMLDMISNKYGVRDIAVDMKGLSNINGISQIITKYDFTNLKDIALSLDISIGEGNYYDEIAQVQTLDNLLQLGQITKLQYFERVPDSIIPKRQELLKEAQAEAMAMMQQTPSQVYGAQGGNIATSAADEQILKTMEGQTLPQQTRTLNKIS